MSEYQYYDFRAIDRPLSSTEISELRALSTRAEITSRSFTNTYNWGNLKGDPNEWMEKYFDAHVYVSNLGSLRFMLRLDKGSILNDVLDLYVVEGSFGYWTTDEHLILEWSLETEDAFESYMDGDAAMGDLLPIRDELMRGDYRALYIGWLSSLASGWGYRTGYEDNEDSDKEDSDKENSDKEDELAIEGVEPPVPPGLGQPSAAQVALADFLYMDRDLLTASGEGSLPLEIRNVSDMDTLAWVGQLSVEEMRGLLARVIVGEGMRVQLELQKRFYADLRGREQVPVKKADRRTANQLLERAKQIEGDRKRWEAEKQRLERKAYLETLMLKLPQLWKSVNELAEKQSGSSYDQSVTILVELRDAYGQAGRGDEFADLFTKFMSRHGQRKKLVERLEKYNM